MTLKSSILFFMVVLAWYQSNDHSNFINYNLLPQSVQGPFGVCSGSFRGAFGIRSGSVRGPFAV